MPIGPPTLEIHYFQSLTLKIQSQGLMTMMLHNNRSRKFNRASNGGNASSGFQSYGFYKVWSQWCLIWHVFGPRASPYEANGRMTMTLHNYTSRKVHETWNAVNPSRNFKDMRLAKCGQNLWQIRQVFGPWESPYGANWPMTMTLHNYTSRQVHETLNGVNPSRNFRDMRSAKSRPNLWQIWQVFGPWESPYRANGQMTMAVHNYRPRQFDRTSNGGNPSYGYKDMGSTNLAAARPWRQYPFRRRADG